MAPNARRAISRFAAARPGGRIIFHIFHYSILAQKALLLTQEKEKWYNDNIPNLEVPYGFSD